MHWKWKKNYWIGKMKKRRNMHSTKGEKNVKWEKMNKKRRARTTATKTTNWNRERVSLIEHIQIIDYLSLSLYSGLGERSKNAKEEKDLPAKEKWAKIHFQRDFNSAIAHIVLSARRIADNAIGIFFLFVYAPFAIRFCCILISPSASLL